MKAKEVISIFEDFEEDVEDEDLTDYEKVKGVLKDVEDKKVRSLWKTFDGYDEKDFMVFKGSVLEYYLGAKKTAKYFLDQLEDLSEENEAQCMTLRRLTDYYSSFSPIALWLEDKEVISRSEADEYFWFGLPKRIRKMVRQELGLDATIPLRKQAFKVTCHILEDEDDDDGDDDLFRWTTTVAEIGQEPQEFGKDEGAVAWVDDLEAMAGITEEVGVEEIAPAVESDDGALAINDNLPAVYNDAPEREDMLIDYEMPPHVADVPATEDVLPAVRNLPAAAEVALGSYEDELAAVKDILASDDMLATDNNIPAEDNNFSEHESIPMSCKIPPADEQVVCKTLRIPRDLLKLQIGYRLPLTGFYGPVSPIFAYAKVRKKDGSVYWSLVKGVPWSHIQLSISTGIRKRAIVSVQRRVVFLSNGLVVQDVLIGTLTKTAIFFEMEGEGLATKQRKRKPSSRRTIKTPYRHIHSLQIIVEKPYDDRSISQTTRGIRNEIEKKTLLEAYQCPASHIRLEAPEELSDFYNVAIYQKTITSRAKTNPAQITYQFSVVTRKRIIASTRRFGRLDDDGNPVIVQRRRRLDNWRSKISKRENVPDFSDHG